jgi:hypothetical protein
VYLAVKIQGLNHNRSYPGKQSCIVWKKKFLEKFGMDKKLMYVKFGAD